MTILTWRKEPPDSEGVWAWSDDGVSVTGVTSSLAFAKPAAFWCRIGDVPEIKPEVKYREPTAADVGRTIEVSNNEAYWGPATLVGFYMNRYVVAKDGDKFAGYDYARIVDDGKPVREAREWWVNVVGDYCFGAPTKEASEALVQPSSTLEKVHVREVIE